MCKTLGVSKSGYYNWLKSGPSKRWSENQMLSMHIKDIFEKSFESYGSPRIKVELEKLGYHVSRPRVARIMRANYLVARINQVWVSDMTYVLTRQGWVYLTVIIDLFNREVVGWAMSDNLSTEATIIPAWNMAINNHKITKELIFHSDRGSQYASYKFTNIIKKYDGLVKQSMSRKDLILRIKTQFLI